MTLIPSYSYIKLFFVFTLTSSQSIQAAVTSLLQVYPQRNMGADEWRSAHLFNIVAAPAQMLNPAQTEKVRIRIASYVIAYFFEKKKKKMLGV